MNNKPLAVVTGASRGIGRAICLSLAASGYNIAGISRTLETSGSKKGLKELKPEIEDIGSDFIAMEADIADVNYHKNIVNEIDKSFGRIDVLVNNAGVAPIKRIDILQTSTESFDRLMGINLRGPFFFSQAIVNYMLDKKTKIKNYNPTVIFITSVSAALSSPERAEYCISKAGLSMASQVFADKLAGTGINVFEIRPGIIQTDMTAPVKEKYDKQIAGGLIPQGRWGKPTDISKAVVSLVIGNFPYSTGTIIELSGGMNIRHL